VLKEYIPAPVRRMARTMRGASSYRRESYAQEGEDLVLARLLEPVGKGFYVDVVAHHPFRFSNTFLFYRMGWRGINIDAMPGSMRPFRRHRRRLVCSANSSMGQDDSTMRPWPWSGR